MDGNPAEGRTTEDGTAGVDVKFQERAVGVYTDSAHRAAGQVASEGARANPRHRAGEARDLDAPPAMNAAAVCVRDRVWWSDVDKMGVMYFGKYVRFAEMAETEFFRAAGYAYDAIHAQFGIWLGRVHLEIDFRYPAKLDDELICRAELRKIGAASMHFRFPVERACDGRRVADIGLTIACLDAVTLKSTRIPSALRERLAALIFATEVSSRS